jgi:hypothetical protein
MRTKRYPLRYEIPQDAEILEAYLYKNASYKRGDARKIKQALRKLALAR